MPLEKSSSDRLLVSQNRESRTKCKRDRRRDRSESSDSSTSSSESRSSSSPHQKRRHSSEKNSRSRKRSHSSKNRKKRKKASKSSDSSSSSPSKVLKRKEKKQKKKHKKEKKKKKEEKDKTSNKMVTAQVNSLPETSVKPKSSAASGSTLGPAPRVLKPMTKEEWEKQQSVMRYVYDEETGRNRLIKGDGEIMEEIVTRDRHREINKTATKGDGNFFASKMGLH